jgi:hypothetical protein
MQSKYIPLAWSVHRGEKREISERWVLKPGGGECSGMGESEREIET